MMRNGLVPKMSSRRTKKRFTGRAPVQPLTRSNALASPAIYAACVFRRSGSPGPRDPLNGLEIFRVRLEVLADRSEFGVQTGGDARPQGLRVQFSVHVPPREFVERLVDHLAPQLRIPPNHEL